MAQFYKQHSSHALIGTAVVILIMLAMVALVAMSNKLLNTNTDTNSHAAEMPDRTYRLSGQFVHNITGPEQCSPDNSRVGLNGVTIVMDGINVRYHAQTVTAVGGSGQPGAYYFSNLMNGMYKICVNSLPDNLQLTYLCSNPTGATNTNRCFYATVNNQNISQTRFSYIQYTCIGRGCP